MDIIGGLGAAKIALDIVKDLRAIDRSVDEAAFKLKLADLTSALADAQLALTDAKIRVAELETAIADLKDGELCPKCRTGRLKLQETRPHTHGGMHQLGVEDWRYTCGNGDCRFEAKRVFDPHGVISKSGRR